MLAGLMELHDENPFKIKSITNASFQVDRAASPIAEMTEAEILGIPGIGKSMATKIFTLLSTGIDPEMDEIHDLDFIELRDIAHLKICAATSFDVPDPNTYQIAVRHL